MTATVAILAGRGQAEACTRGFHCGALPTYRVQYRYPDGTLISFGACSVHAKKFAARHRLALPS